MARAIVGVVVGYILWSVMWVGAGILLLKEAGAAVRRGEHFAEVGPLAMAIGISVICSLAAGFACAKIAPAKARAAAMVLGLCLMATGIFVQMSIWNLEPVWYHLAFLVLLVPVTLLGARIGK